MKEFGKLSPQERIEKAFIFNNSAGIFLITLEENNKLGIYIIKGYINMMDKKDPKANSYYLKSSNISSFRMGKKATLELDYPPNFVEFYGDYMLIIYKSTLESNYNSASS